ncbi:hypothetical protein F8388_015138 [Cannabis sativa]|uniref:Zinc knuckle CX2CX4HX4C domain-containing protein n=1 Tax=Cannabis sativa TaxID=3483 RepID=A0A7J6ER26_CANSA|nr:hypothetical protein F8388_015138 [Cannabis sativa]
MALDNGKDIVDSTKVIHVESVDETMNNVLTRDSAMEMELLELFEDITLEEVVANGACVGKVIGCKDMPASVVKKILTGVWRRLGLWRMKKCDEGVLGFFFENEDDCAFVLDKRPWLVNGVLLNLKPWPVEGEVRMGEFEVARFWVQFHGLPTRCLSNDNAPIVAKKVGSFVMVDYRNKTELVRRGYIRAWIDVWVAHPFPVGFFLTADGKPESWVQFKYEKLPHLCFNCGQLAHWDKICHSPMAMVTLKMGKAVQMYLEKEKPWKKKGEPEATEKGKELVSAVERTSAPEVMRNDRENVRNRTVGRCKVDDVAVQIPPRGELEARVLPDIGPNFLNLPQPDFALVNNEKSIPDIGPTLAQCIEVPHDWLCRSQKPHSFPKPLPIYWPNKDSEAQKLFFQLYRPDFLNLYKAQQSIICYLPDLSEMINHLLGNNRKRKAHCWLQPFPASPHFELPDCPVKEKSSDQDEIGAFCMGSTEKGEGSIGNRRGRKPKGKEKKSAIRKFSGVKTRSGRKKIIALDDLELSGFCVAWSLGVQCHVIETFEVGFKIEVNLGNGLSIWSLFCVYGSPYQAQKNSFWQWLTEKVADCNSPWVVIGDLNVISNGSEKAGGRRYNRNEGELLNNFLFEMGGVDLGCDGGCFRWQNSRVACNQVRKRLDRAIADANWCMDFLRARVSSFPILGSDHAPIVLNVWGDHAKLKYPVSILGGLDNKTGLWGSGESGLAGYAKHLSVEIKLKGTAKELKLWNQNVFGFCDRKLIELRKQLGWIQNEPINDYNIMKEAEIQLEILSTEENMNRIWKQKSRERWLRFEDETGEWVRDRVNDDKFQALFESTYDLAELTHPKVELSSLRT